MVKIIDTDFTDLEVEILELLAGCLNMANPEDELDNGNVCLLIPADLEHVTGGPKVARGVISSLVKKGWMDVSENSDPERLGKMRAEYWAEDRLIPYLFALPPKDAGINRQIEMIEQHRAAIESGAPRD